MWTGPHSSYRLGRCSFRWPKTVHFRSPSRRRRKLSTAAQLLSDSPRGAAVRGSDSPSARFDPLRSFGPRDPLDMTPTASTATTMAMGDALCMGADGAQGGSVPRTFLHRHSGGALGTQSWTPDARHLEGWKSRDHFETELRVARQLEDLSRLLAAHARPNPPGKMGRKATIS
jgi:hypothetical protein